MVSYEGWFSVGTDHVHPPPPQAVLLVLISDYGLVKDEIDL
jgi:hypothetical protein